MLLPGALMMGIMSPITGRLFDRYGARYLALTGLTLLLVGTITFLTLTNQTPVISIIIFYAIRMFGVTMVFMPVTTSGMNVLPLTNMSHGTAVNNIFRQSLSSIGTAIMTTVLTNITNLTKPVHSVLVNTPLLYRHQYIDATINGFHAAFATATLFALVATIMAFFLKSGNKTQDIDLEQLKAEVED